MWGPTHARDTHYLRIYMKQLRDKLEADPVRPRHLLTETGVGYRLLADRLDVNRPGRVASTLSCRSVHGAPPPQAVHHFSRRASMNSIIA